MKYIKTFENYGSVLNSLKGETIGNWKFIMDSPSGEWTWVNGDQLIHAGISESNPKDFFIVNTKSGAILNIRGSLPLVSNRRSFVKTYLKLVKDNIDRVSKSSFLDKVNSLKESTDYASSSYEIPKWLSDTDKKKVKDIIKHLKGTVNHVQYDKYVDRIDKIIKDATPTKSNGSKMCMKDDKGHTVGR